MFSKQENLRILASCLSVLFLAFFATFTVFFMDSKQEDALSFTLSMDEYAPFILFVTLFAVYPILVVAFTTPFVILKHYNVSIWMRVLVYIIAGAIIMLIPTFLDSYEFISILVALLFGLFDFIWSRKDTSID
ncbi:hypothetical protein QPK24_13455 [Paenibacillus polygoni]|uniref:Uncharacterized protein n=1 Tax=Paenibacillus polygoni TaxID=3050112 RepID=A0ABY8WXH2_9BACL|nr:hypothetical protein [Paenibacillus polygoni]WIV17434.1 hypothetical protein QPK24_13455 [Paenibacillus polygoni]